MGKQQDLSQKLRTLRADWGKSGATLDEWRNKLAQSATKLNLKNDKDVKIQKNYKMYVYAVVVCIIAVFAYSSYTTMDPKCIVSNNMVLVELSRPAVSCDLCQNLEQVPTVDGDTFTKEAFLANFAYNGVPLLVKGGARNWTALETFSFDYLKELFEDTDGALEAVSEDCQFFRYNTEFLSMAEVFQMSEAQSQLLPGEKEWYVGWSNCHPDVAKELRKHYERPPFLPDDSESSNLDWLFMGGFGGGAGMHIDYVQRPSWQAMISGTKSWKLLPSPECASVCKTLNATMERGDIILVDTNMWYHSTYIHPGNMSLTIGSEYD